MVSLKDLHIYSIVCVHLRQFILSPCATAIRRSQVKCNYSAALYKKHNDPEENDLLCLPVAF